MAAFRSPLFLLGLASSAATGAISCSVGDAAADGSQATVSSPITIAAIVGNAVAAGETSSIPQTVTISGVTAIDITASGARPRYTIDIS